MARFTRSASWVPERSLDFLKWFRSAYATANGSLLADCVVMQVAMISVPGNRVEGCTWTSRSDLDKAAFKRLRTSATGVDDVRTSSAPARKHRSISLSPLPQRTTVGTTPE